MSLLSALLPVKTNGKLDAGQTRTECLSGLTVALALVPEAVAFAFVAMVHPMVGLHAAFIVCLLTSIFGGRPGMISGATGALAVVMVHLVQSHGVEYLFAAVVLMGILQALAGIFRLGKFIRIVPHPVMLGFVNGLAIVIFLSQLDLFKVDGEWLASDALYIMLGLVALTMAIIILLPKFTKAVPASLAAIGIVFAVTWMFGIHTRNVGDFAAIAGQLPQFSLPSVPFTWETLRIILPYSCILASIGLIETLLALTLVDEITQTKGRNSRECVAQGAANIVSGFCSSMGGCAMIGQSMINIHSGARHRLSGVVAAVCLIVFIVFASGIIEQIPLAALIGVMFMVVIGTFAWSSLRIMHKIPLSDAFVIVLVSATTVMFDLAIAVVVGVIVSALVYVWESAHHLTATTEHDDDTDTKTYHLFGQVFFGSVSSFRDLFHPTHDPQQVVIDFEHSRVWDHSGIEALKLLAEKYKKAGKKIRFKRLSNECAKLLKKAGYAVEVDTAHDPKYDLVIDRDKL